MRALFIGNMRKGSSTLEILIAFAVLLLAMTGVILLSFSNQSSRVDAQTNSEALTKAEGLLEDARATSRKDFDLVTSIPSSQDGIYQKSLSVQSIDDSTKQVTSNVLWAIDNRSLAVHLTTLVTNWLNLGDTCNPNVSGDWTHPQLLGNADVGQNNGGTDVVVVNHKAYVTANASSAAKHDFYIVNVSNPYNPSLPILNSINTGPGLAAVTVYGKYAYVANMSTVSQLQIINIDPTDPQYLTVLGFHVPGNVGTAVGNSIFYANKKIYLGLTKTPTGPGTAVEFNVYDVSIPTSPSFLGGYRTNTLINNIVVK
ncbi:MAG: hypothetical protein AAB482_01575, partial [Patescibacteria group bacterium]